MTDLEKNNALLEQEVNWLSVRIGKDLEYEKDYMRLTLKDYASKLILTKELPFDEILKILGVPYTKGSPWYEDRKEKIKQLLNRL